MADQSESSMYFEIWIHVVYFFLKRIGYENMKHHVKYKSLKKEETWQPTHILCIPLHGNCLRKMLTSAQYQGFVLWLTNDFQEMCGFYEWMNMNPILDLVVR